MRIPDSSEKALSAIGLMLLLATAFCPSLMAGELSAAEMRGKQLYLGGISPSGQAIKASIGAESTELLASDVPCAGCHGENGKGSPEGGIVPSDISFEHLSLAYGHNHDNGRKHGAFNDKTIIMAIQNGIDPSGNRLDDAMPRYKLSAGDSADLIAYLKRISTDLDPGLSETEIRLGTLLPVSGPLAGMGLAMKNMLTAYLDEINRRGGVYNRKLRLVVAEHTGNAASTLNNVRRLLADDGVFAMVAPFTGGLEQELLSLTAPQGLPEIGAYTGFPENDTVRNRSAFYLLPGLEQESRAMVDYAANRLRLSNARLMVIAAENSNVQKIIAAIERQGELQGFSTISHFTYRSEQLDSQTFDARLNGQSADAILFLGSNHELRQLLKSLERLKLHPYLFVSGSLTANKIPDEPGADKIYLSFPWLPREPMVADEFFQLVAQNRLTTQYLAAQALCYSAAKVLTEALKKTGRELSRKKLIATLEKFNQFDTGLIPPVTFAANRHMGVSGVFIVSARGRESQFVLPTAPVETNH